jgi:hypothetical protein
MTWMQRLKRVFAIEIERCCRCGGKLEVIGSIEEPALIERILAQVRRSADDEEPAPFAARAPPQPSLLLKSLIERSYDALQRSASAALRL